MKQIKIFIVFLLVLNIGINTKAYTKEDIINKTNTIELCDTKTKILVKGLITSYQRLLNERNISNSDLNKIYNNIDTVIKILKKYNVCSIDDKDKLPSNIINNLYSLYKTTNNIILNSKKLTDTIIKDSNIVIDSSNNQIKIYEDGTLSDVIKIEEKLNYVGLNKILIISILAMLIILTFIILLKVLKKSNILTSSMLYVTILLLFITTIFRNEISILLDTISIMNIKENNQSKEILVQNQTIISYPSYGDSYAKIYINNNIGDIYFGDNNDILKKGIGQSSSSYLIGEGNTVLSGHNTNTFKELFNINKNDTFIIETVYGKFTYKVIDILVTNEKDIESIKKDYDLTMYTCYPNISLYNNQRLIVYSNIIESEWIGNYEN